MSKPAHSSYVGCCDRWIDGLSRGMVVMALLFLAIMTTLIALQVISRNMFNMGLPWADELARFTGIATVFFTIPFLQYKGEHIAVNIFINRLDGRAATALRAANETIVFGFCMLLLMGFASFFQRAAYFSTPATGMPNWLYYAPALLGIAACALVVALRLVRLLRNPGTSAIDEERKT